MTLSHEPAGPGWSSDEHFPPSPTVAAELPPSAKRYLEQALNSLQSPDAAAVMAASAVDAMLKARGFAKGSLYDRINEAKEDAVLTADMAEWAHKVRLESNRPRHADSEDPHVSLEEARQVIEFADSLGDLLFVLPAKIQEGIAAAEKIDGA